MTQDTIKQSYRGVRCLSCRQPIPLPAILLRMESANKGKESDSPQEHHARVFSLRCRSCEREKPYRATDVIDFEGAPKPRLSRYRSTHASGLQSGGQSRTANG